VGWFGTGRRSPESVRQTSPAATPPRERSADLAGGDAPWKRSADLAGGDAPWKTFDEIGASDVEITRGRSPATYLAELV